MRCGSSPLGGRPSEIRSQARLTVHVGGKIATNATGASSTTELIRSGATYWQSFWHSTRQGHGSEAGASCWQQPRVADASASQATQSAE